MKILSLHHKMQVQIIVFNEQKYSISITYAMCSESQAIVGINRLRGPE